MGLTHFDSTGNARMVDVGHKEQTLRKAVAEGFITISQEVYDLIVAKDVKKGDVLSVAQLAAIMGAKKTSDLIPLCHPLSLTKVSVFCSLVPDRLAVRIEACVETKGPTGVEMEALTAVQVGLLTVYDMCKAMDKNMIMGPTRLLEKDGGRSGHFIAHKSDI